jgi:hypothetical protein
MSLTEHPGYLLWERTLQKTDCRVTFTVDAAAEPQPLALGCVFACTGDDLRVSGGKMDMYSLDDNRLATFQPDHDRTGHLSVSPVLMKHRTVARAGNVDVPPAHNRHDDRTEAWVRFRQDALWGIPEAHRLLRPLGKEVAWDTRLGLKSFKSFFRRKRSRKIKKLQRTLITAIACAREQGLLFKRSSFYQ